MIDYRVLGPGDLDLLMSAPQLFDDPLREDSARAFLAAAGQLMVLALDGGTPVGFASGTVLLHPDKRPSLFVNEVGVEQSHQRRGIGRELTRRLIAHAEEAHGCTTAWLATEPDNAPALALYRSMAGDEETFRLFGWGFLWNDEN